MTRLPSGRGGTVAGARRASYGIAGQVLNAATNVVTVYLASLLLLPAAFGEFALAFTLITVVLAAGRGLVGATMQVHLPALDEGARRDLERSAMGFTLIVGLVASVVLSAIGTGAVAWLAPWVVAALLQDAARYVFLASLRQGSALLLDVAWAVAQGATIGGAALLGAPLTIPLLATAWGVGAVAGVVLFVALTGLRPARPGPWVRTTRDVAGWFTAVAVTSQLELYLVLLVTSTLLGPADAGGLRAVQLLAYQPAMVLLGALMAVVTPSVVRVRDDPAALARVQRRVLVLTSPVIVVLLAIALLREPLMGLLFGQYVALAGLVVPVALQGVFACLGVAPTVVLRALRRGRAGLLVQIARLVLIVSLASGGCLAAGPTGLAWGLATGSLIVLGILVATSARAVRCAPGTVPSGPDGPNGG